jgi:hypothetical protein
MTEKPLDELAEQFDLHDAHDVSDIPSEIVEAMRYIDNRTGLLGDYNTGRVHLCEGGRKIQWYPRGRYFSSHDDLLQWVGKHDRLLIGCIGTRNHVVTSEPTGYAEIHPVSIWEADDE